MRAIFPTAEIVSLLNHRVPRGRSPQFRLQNFLLGREDWETSTRASLHIGEQGEFDILRRSLGKKYEVESSIRRAFGKRSWDRGGPKRGLIFPTEADYKEFVGEVEKAWGPKVTLRV